MDEDLLHASIFTGVISLVQWHALNRPELCLCLNNKKNRCWRKARESVNVRVNVAAKRNT
jgi:hypothetical protein